MKTFLLKLDNEVHKNWSDEAAKRKTSLSEFIRASVNAQLGSNGNGSTAVHDAGGSGEDSAPRRRRGVAGGVEGTFVDHGTSTSFVNDKGFETAPLPAAAGTIEGSAGVVIAHAPTCSCMLCASRKKKKPAVTEKPKKKFRR